MNKKLLDIIILKKKGKYIVDWNEVWKNENFKKLLTTEQNPYWHKENLVSIHTKYVVEQMYKYANDDSYLSYILIVSALFHDIGKGECTFFNNDKGTWSSPQHAKVGAEITRNMLSEENEDFIDVICWFVENHMKPLEIYDSKQQIKDLIKLSNSSPNIKYCNIENLFKLKNCDCLGSKMVKYDGWVEKLNYLKNLAKKYKCFYRPQEL